MPRGMRDRVWSGMHELAAMAGSGAGHRRCAQCGHVTLSDMGVPHPWSLNAVIGPATVSDEDLDAAIIWLRRHDRGFGWRVSVPPALQDEVAHRAQLTRVDALPLYAMRAASAAALEAVHVEGLAIARSEDLAEVRAAYGGWMADEPLASMLLSAADMTDPRRAFLVARVAGQPVGCALVWWVAGTGYLSGIGVVAEHRRRGIGRALTSEAALVAAAGAHDTHAPDVIWMGATTEGAALYERMGFTHVDDEVRLGPTTGAHLRARAAGSHSRRAL